MKLKALFAILLLVTLAACGGGGTSASVADAGAATAVLELPPEVDVHTVEEIRSREDVYLLDVRERWEYDEGHIPDVTLIPVGEVPQRLSEIPTDGTVIVTCRSGNRSGQVTDFLRQNGFDNVHNMAGGIVAWEQAGFEVIR